MTVVETVLLLILLKGVVTSLILAPLIGSYTPLYWFSTLLIALCSWSLLRSRA